MRLTLGLFSTLFEAWDIAAFALRQPGLRLQYYPPVGRGTPFGNFQFHSFRRRSVPFNAQL